MLQPKGINVDSHNHIYVIGAGTSSVQKFSSNGTLIPPKLMADVQGQVNMTSLEDIEIDLFDNIYLTDRQNNNFIEYSVKK